jgi:hypothetical protein
VFLSFPEVNNISMVKFHPFGTKSAPNKEMYDPTAFWVPNAEGAKGMLLSAGFQNVEMTSHPSPLVFRAESPTKSIGQPPDWNKAPSS